MCEPAAHAPALDGRCVCHTITAPVVRGILDEIAARHPDRERMVAELAHVDRLIAEDARWHDEPHIERGRE